MRPAGDARASWNLLEQANSLADLRTAIGLEGEPSALASGQRSACWKAFLLFEGTNRAEWPPILADSRSAYNSLRGHFLRAIENPDELGSALDPLSENNESPWVALRKDEALRAEIFQDIERCMPDNTYFRQPDTQKIMLDILFIFCKLNPDIGYRQGMHELLAPILWVVERDAIETSGDHGEDLMLALYDARFIEHDAFTLYGLVMQSAKTFYEPSRTSNSADSPMLVRSRHIFDDLLPLADPQLAAHLKEIEVAPQMFLMRWMRLLFGREFAFDDMLPMWDLLFAADPTLHLVDFVSIAMLLRIRWQLLESDANGAITILLRYPQPASEHPPRTFVQDAVQLKNDLSPEAGARMVSKYSGRTPVIPSQQRPQTPLLDRISSPQRQKSPFGTIRGLQDAARDIQARGEKWGLNQVVRDAVGDFKKTMRDIQKDIQAAQVATANKAVTPGAPRKGIESLLIEKVSALEDRNKALAKMLEGAVADLWDCQKAAVESKEADKATVDNLSMAIARVQFVQVYLEDASIPLPVEEQKPKDKEADALDKAASPRPSTGNPKSSPLVAGPANSALPPTSVTGGKTDGNSESVAAAAAAAAAAAPAIITSPPRPTSTASNSTAPTTPKNPITAATTVDPAASTHRNRPSLAQSSFSWMLGQEETAEPASSFAAASNYNSWKPVDRRRKGTAGRSGNGSSGSSGGAGGTGGAGKGNGGDGDGRGGSKAFLFGDEDDGLAGPGGVGGSMKSVFGKGRGGNAVVAGGPETPSEVYDLGELEGVVGSVGAGAGTEKEKEKEGESGTG